MADKQSRESQERIKSWKTIQTQVQTLAKKAQEVKTKSSGK